MWLCLILALNLVQADVVGKNPFNPYSVDGHLLNEWKNWDGFKVSTVDVIGLSRTDRQTVLWMLEIKVGGEFSHLKLGEDIQRLYNTSVLYDIAIDISPTNEKEIGVTFYVKEKWTIFPVFGAQGGGGSQVVGGGAYDSNFWGHMITAQFYTWNYNNTTSYDLNFNQEYWRDTPLMWSVDVQDSISPLKVRSTQNVVLGNFAWRRQQTELMIGTHFENVRLLGYASIFQDSVFTNNNVSIATPDHAQQKFYPKIILGRVNWSNYLEVGEEKTAQWTLANIFGSGPTYVALELDYKHVWIVGSEQKDNAAVFASYSQMGSGGPNYFYNLGGYQNVRGYADFREFGRKMFFVNLEYRPLIMTTRLKFLNLDQLAVQFCVFSDAGSAWGDSGLSGEAAAQNMHTLWSAGAGFRFNFVKFSGAILRFDWARTINPDEGIDFSFGVGQWF